MAADSTQPHPPRQPRDPAPGPADQHYFDACAEGVLLVKRCMACTAYHHYPRALCPFCLSDDVRWTNAAGSGEIHTFSVTRPAGGAAYCIAYVRLDEGVTMMTNIVDCDFNAVFIGQRVRVVFRKTQGGMSVPMFTPA